VYGDPIAVDGPGPAPVLAPCDEVKFTPAIGKCAPGASVVSIDANLNDSNVTNGAKLARRSWPAATVTPAQLATFTVRGLVVATNGSSADIERVRTALVTAMPFTPPPSTLAEISANDNRTILELRQMTNVVIVVSLVVAGCSLAVSVTGGVTDRKRPFSLLRLTGVPVGALRRVVALEAGVPLIVVSVLSAGTGFVAAALFLRSQLNESLQPPGVGYYALVVAGLVLALAVIGSTLPLIERITGPDVARNE